MGRKVNKRVLKWKFANRFTLFDRIVAEVGPHRRWKKSTAPGRGLDGVFKSLVRAYARIMGTTSAAVMQQIRFGCPIKTRNPNNWNQCQARTAIGCLAASLEAGFIVQREIPELIASKAPRKRKPLKERNDLPVRVEAHNHGRSNYRGLAADRQSTRRVPPYVHAEASRTRTESGSRYYTRRSDRGERSASRRAR